MDLSGLRVGMTGDAALVVDETKTALALGSGSALVLGTPALIILMEMAALQCVEALLPAGAVSLGTVVNVEHVAPSPLGARVTARAELTAIEPRLDTRSLPPSPKGVNLFAKNFWLEAVVLKNSNWASPARCPVPSTID